MASPRLADFGDAARAGGPPKTILTPPPPPAPPPPATRRAQGIASPRTPLDGGFDRPPPPTRTPPATRTPVGMSAPVVPQHRNDMLHKMLRGLEDDSLTVADVLGVLETELRSGAPSAAPLSEQFERYLGPLQEFSGSAPGPGPASRGPGGMPRGPSPAPGSAPLMGPAPGALAVPALGPGPPRSISPAATGGRPGGQDGSQVVLANCARCNVLDQQVKALAQSLSGLGARMFNWSLAHCRENTERNGLWHLVLKYLQPVSTVDARIAETCTGLQAAVGTSVADPTPGPPTRNKRGGGRNNGGKGMSGGANIDDGQVWHPPGVGFDSTAAGGRAPRFAESMGHMAAAPESLAASSEHSPMRSPLDKEAHDQLSTPSPSRKQVASVPVEKQAASMTTRRVQIGGAEKEQVDVQKSPTMRRALQDPEHTRAMPVLPYSPPLPVQQGTSESQGAVQAPNQVSVRFTASQLCKKLNGTYQKVVGATNAGRPVYSRGQKYLLYLSDGTWAIKDGPEADVDADVYAYVKDDAHEPYNVQRPWQVPADGDGFAADSKSAVTPGRSDHSEAAAAKSVKKQVEELAKRAGGRQPGAKAEAAMDKREAAERWQKEAMERGAPRIRVTIVSASGLASVDNSGKSDPFVVCQVPGKKIATFETPHVNNTTDPRWDHQEEVLGWEVGDTLRFSVYDKDSGSDRDLLGVTSLESVSFWPDGFDGELTLEGTQRGIISKLRLRVFVLERGKPGFITIPRQRSEQTSPQAGIGKAPAATTVHHAEAAGVGEIDEYEEDYDDEYEEEDILFAKIDNERRQQESQQQESDEELLEFTEEEEKMYKAAFDKIDHDGSGKISLQELQDNIDVLGHHVTPKELRQLAIKVDKDGDDIDFDEFLDLVQHFYDLEMVKLKRMFSQFDQDRSGFIDAHEALEIFQNVSGLTEDDITGMMKHVDDNDDGVIDFDEFIQLMTMVKQDAQKRSSQETIDTAGQKSEKKPKLAPSDMKRVKAYLKRKGFDPEDVNSQRKVGTGFSKKGFEYPLHTATTENLSDMVWLLLESKADPVAQNSAGQTAMELAVKGDKKGSHKAVQEHLLSYMRAPEAALSQKKKRTETEDGSLTGSVETEQSSAQPALTGVSEDLPDE